MIGLPDPSWMNAIFQPFPLFSVLIDLGGKLLLGYSFNSGYFSFIAEIALDSVMFEQPEIKIIPKIRIENVSVFFQMLDAFFGTLESFNETPFYRRGGSPYQGLSFPHFLPIIGEQTS
jgi:hypothetical protein